VLEHILSAEFAGASELRSQLDRTEVIAIWGPDSVSVDLQVREPCEHTALPEPLVPVDAQVHDPSGAYIGELLVWTDQGVTLAALEFAGSPTRCPHPSRMSQTYGSTGQPDGGLHPKRLRGRGSGDHHVRHV
jgi:hypothetical protein